MKFLNKLRLENLKKSLVMVTRRMPIPVTLILATTFLFLFRIYTDILSTEAERIIDKTILTLVVTFIFSVGIYLFHEVGNFSKKMRGVFQIDSIFLALAFFYFFDENLFHQSETLVYIMVTLAGVISFTFIAPFIKIWLEKRRDQQKFIDHTSLLTWKGFLSGVVGVLMMWLGFAALAALFALFDIDLWLDSEKTFSTWAVFSLSFVAPLFFLINLPRTKEIITWKKNKFHSFVVNYLGLPAIIIYFLILYAYTIKVLINFTDWPQGKIAWLVIGFSIFGYLIYFTLESFREKFKAARVFQKFFPALVLPQVAMLFYAIALRIGQHDWTINRYLVVVFGIWLTILSIYYTFSRHKDLGFMPASLTIIILLISIGPWSVYLFPENRQLEKLENNLQQAQILQNGRIVSLEDYDDIDPWLSGEIYGSIEYLCRYHGCQTMGKVFGSKSIENKSSYELSEEIKVRRYYSNLSDRAPQSISFGISRVGYENQEIDVSGYDLLIYLSGPKEENDKLLSEYGLSLDYTDLEKQLLQKYSVANLYHFEVEPEDLSWELESDKYLAKVQLEHFTIDNPDKAVRVSEDKLRPVSLVWHNGYILLKEK